MSSIVINGDTSGSITLQAPAIAGSNTVTLPATTGYLFVNPAPGTLTVSNGGTGVADLTTAYGVLAAGTTTTGAVQNIGTGTATQVLTSNGPGVLPSFQTLTIPPAGNYQYQLFTSPGTWTKPASISQVRVTVIGGGGGGGGGPTGSGAGASGNTSSFGSLVSATGGGGGPNTPAPSGSSGSGTVTTGTSIKTSFSQYLSVGSMLFGNLAVSAPKATPVAYSSSSAQQAGAAGSALNLGGNGGLAIASCPVAAPIAVTVGAGGAGGGSNPAAGAAGDGVVLVEFVG